jgi:peptide/nickel transport system permease protein
VGGYLVRRLGLTALGLFGSTVVVFLMVRLIPGTIVEQMLGTEALTMYESIESLRRYFGLDRPVHVQYLEWLGRVLRGDLGHSWRAGVPVAQLVLAHLAVTAELTAVALAVAVAVGVSAGAVAALARGSFLDGLIRVVGLFGLSVPVFWQGTVVIIGLSLAFRWALPTRWVSPLEDPLENLKMLLVPGVCLGTVSAAVIMRMTRSCLLEVLRQDYIKVAYAKGLSSRAVVLGHALKNALIPVLTVVGLQAGYLLAGVVVVEEVFTLPGVGRLLLWAIYQRDYPTVQGAVLVIATLYMGLNLLVDLLYGLIDPRIRYG